MARPALERISQREYARRLNVSNEAVSKAVKEGRIKKGWDEKERKIIVNHANAEWGNFHIQQNAKRIVSTPAGGALNEEEPVGNDSGALTNHTSYANAKRVKEIALAQHAILDLKKRKGELVEKGQVYKQLFSFGQQLRTALMAIPDRSIDEILSKKTRAEAHLALTEAIHKVLEAATKKEVQISDSP